MRVFADTFFFLALLDSSDSAHAAARTQARRGWRSIYTTDYVLVELGNALCAPADRRDFTSLVTMIRRSPIYHLVAASDDLLESGLRLFADRPDKHWSLTDCLSMVVMRDQGLTDVLTADHHFEQAGFRALFLADRAM